MTARFNYRTENLLSKTIFERELNEKLSSLFTLEECLNMWSYIVKNPLILTTTYNKKKLGSRIRRLDPVYFEVAYEEWLKEKKL